MAVVAARKIFYNYYRATVSNITLSGTVVVTPGVGVSRSLLIFRKNDFSNPYFTVADSSGNWSLTLKGNLNDQFLVICLGNSIENSEIYDHIME